MAAPTYPRWSFGVGPAVGAAPVGEIIRATTRKWTRRLNKPDQVSLALNGRSDVAIAMRELETDVWVARGTTALSRLRLAVPNHDIDSDFHGLKVDAFDYTWILQSRLLVDGDAALNHAAVDQAQIVWLLIQATQGRTSGGLGITQGTHGFTAGAGSTGILRDRAYKAGDGIGKLIDQLAAVDQGFDFEIDATLKLQVWYAQKGADNGVVLDYGGAVAKVQITGNQAAFNNVSYVTGAEGTTPVYQATAGIGADARGRWEKSFQYSTVVENATLTQKANGLTVERSRAPLTYKLTLRRGVWQGPIHIDVGDTVRVNIKSGALVVSGSYRVVEIVVTLTEAGEELVVVNVEEP